MIDEMETLLASDKLFKQNEKGNSLNKKQEKGGPKRNEKNKNCLKLPPSPLVRWLPPFITLLSQKKFLLIAGT